MDEIENANEVPEVEQQTEIPSDAAPENQDSEPEKKEEPQETEAERRARKERNRAIREKYRAEAEAKHLRERLEAVEREVSQRRTEQPAELRPESFSTQAEYEQAMIDQRIEAAVAKRLEQERQQARQRAEQTELQRARETFAQKTAEAQEVYPDFEDVVSSAASMPISPAIERALMKADNGADLVYHFAKNPEDLEKLNRLNPIDAAIAIAKLDMKVQRPTTKASAAPKPIKPVTSAQTAPSGEPDVSDERAWLAWRTKQVQKQYQR